MKKSYRNFCLLLVVSLLSMRGISYGKSIVFSQAAITYANLDVQQRLNYDKVIAQGVYHPEIILLTYDREAIYDADGLLALSVGTYLDSFEFKVTLTDYTNDEAYTWVGEYVSHDTTKAYNHGILHLVSHGQRIFGTLQIGHRSYQVYDLGSGILLLAEYRMAAEEGSICAADGPGAELQQFTHPRDCKALANKFKVLVIYTTGAAAQEPDIWGKALAGISDLNHIWANSQVPNTAVLAGVEVVNLYENTDPVFSGSDRIESDVNEFSSYPDIMALRSSYKADAVLFITRPVYGGTYGYAKQIGGGFQDAFAIVSVAHAVSGRRSFAHEVCHLFGAKHNIPLTGDYAHGYSITLGYSEYPTLMCMLNDGSRIPYLSNPNVNYVVIPYVPIPTGTQSTYNNARKVSEYKNQVNGFYDDDVPFSVSISITDIDRCDQYGTATAVVPPECTGPFQYAWSYSDNGVTWQPVSGATGASISTFVPYPLFATMYGTFNTRQYRVRVTRSIAPLMIQSATGTATAHYNCPSSIFQWGAAGVMRNVDRFAVYPNPVQDAFNLDCTLEREDEVTINLYNMAGRQVKNLYTGKVSKGINRFTFQKDWAAGIYLLRIYGKNTKFEKRINSL